MKLNFKICGSGYQIIMPCNDLPAPFIGVHFGMIDREVDGLFYWCPDKDAITKGSIFPAWVLRGIADEVDRLNFASEIQLNTARRTERVKAVFDVDGSPESDT